MDTYQTYIPALIIFVASGQVIFLPAPIICLLENAVVAYNL